MEDEEVVISSWKRSDFQKELDEAIERRPTKNTGDNESKENVILSSQPLRDDSRNKKPHRSRSDDGEINLEHDALSKLIDGNSLKSYDNSESLTMTNSRPIPKPRLKGHSNTERDDLVDNLFLSENDKLFENYSKTSPHPVPRPRLKPVLKGTTLGSLGNEDVRGDSGKSPKIRADKLFDAVGKGKKSVSFEDLSRDDGFLSKGDCKKFGEINYDGDSGIEESLGNKSPNEVVASKQKFPPSKPARTISADKTGKIFRGDESGNYNSKLHSHVLKTEKTQRNLENDNSNQKATKHKSFGKQVDEPHNGLVSESKKFSNDFTIFDSEREDSEGIFNLPGKAPGDQNVESMDHHIREGRISGNSTLFKSKQQSMVKKQNAGKRSELTEKNFERNGDMLKTSGNFSTNHHDMKYIENGSTKEQGIQQMFEEHVPNIEGVVQQTEKKNKSEAKSKRNIPLKAEKRLEEMTKSPELYNFQHERRSTPQKNELSEEKGSPSIKRSSSLTNVNNGRINQFEGDNKYDEDSLESWQSGYTSSRNIREAAFNEWLERKRKGLKEKVKKKVEQDKEEEEKLKEKQERESSAKKAFEVWSSKKEGVIKNQTKKKKELVEKEIDAKREKIAKKQDAKKFFESWKNKKDKVLKDNYKEKKMKEKEAKQKEAQEKREKMDIAKKSYDKWKMRKDEQLKEELENKKRSDKIKTQYEKEADTERRQECEKTFQEFLRKKGTAKRTPPSPSLTQRPWCPGGLTRGTNLIPGEIQPVILTPTLNRSRSFSGTTSATSFHKSSRSGRAW